jgi:putative ABC transport system ATP-binding protein
MITLKNITKKYQTSEIESTVLNNVNLVIEKGEFVAIMGPSGSGKSTLLHILGMLDAADSGSYEFQGIELSGKNESALANIRKNNIGFIFQSFNLIDELTVEENIEIPLLYQKVPVAERKKRIAGVMDKVGISHRAKHLPKQLSGGQQQRVAVARALVAEPNMILADEPTGNLDSKNGKEVMDLLEQLNAEGTTILMVTHTKEHAKNAKRVIMVLDGSIIADNIEAPTRATIVTPEEIEQFGEVEHV